MNGKKPTQCEGQARLHPEARPMAVAFVFVADEREAAIRQKMFLHLAQPPTMFISTTITTE